VQQQQPEEHQASNKATFQNALNQLIPKHGCCSIIKHAEWIVKQYQHQAQSRNPLLHPTKVFLVILVKFYEKLGKVNKGRNHEGHFDNFN